MEIPDNIDSQLSTGKRKAQQLSFEVDNLELTSSQLSTSSVSSKRKDIINWDEYFMSIAFLSSLRSKDPNTQVGACIVNPDKKIVAIGYNGFPRGCSDDELSWERTAESKYDTKYMVSISFNIMRIYNHLLLTAIYTISMLFMQK